MQFEIVGVLAFEGELQRAVGLRDEARQLIQLLGSCDLCPKRGVLRKCILKPLEPLLLLRGIVIPQHLGLLGPYLHLIILLELRGPRHPLNSSLSLLSLARTDIIRLLLRLHKLKLFITHWLIGIKRRTLLLLLCSLILRFVVFLIVFLFEKVEKALI